MTAKKFESKLRIALKAQILEKKKRKAFELSRLRVISAMEEESLAAREWIAAVDELVKSTSALESGNE